MTPEQLATFKADILANTNQAVIDALAEGNNNLIRDWYNGDSTFWAWKSDVPAGDVGNAINMENLGNIVAANAERLQTAFTIVGVNSGSFHPTRTDHRAFFADMFSGANGTETRNAMIALWQRLANEVEKLFATGTGTQATGEIDDGTGMPDAGSPGELTYEGTASRNDVRDALNLP